MNLLKFSFESPQLNVRPHGSSSQTEFHFHKSLLDKYQNAEFYSIWNQGNVTDIYVESTEDVSLVNMKKSLVSLFQFQTKEGKYNEVRASGSCQVTYRETSQTGLRRMKQNCVLAEKSNRFVRAEKPLQVTAQNYRSTDYEFFSDGSVSKIESRDYFHIALEANRDIGGSVDSVIVLVNDAKPKKINAVDEKSPKEFLANLKNYKGLKLQTHEQIIEKPTDSNIEKLINDNVEALESAKIGTVESANAFLQILPVARRAAKTDLVQLLKSTNLKEFKVSLSGSWKQCEDVRLIQMIFSASTVGYFGRCTNRCLTRSS